MYATLKAKKSICDTYKGGILMNAPHYRRASATAARLLLLLWYCLMTAGVSAYPGR